MPLLEALPLGSGVAQWPLWSTVARIVVTDPARLPVARRIVEGCAGEVERACSRFRPDSELARLPRGDVVLSPLLAELVATALTAAERTDGDVDPTVGPSMGALGYDRDFALVGSGASVRPVPAPGWRQVRLAGRTLSRPDAVELDLGATAKAWAADECARRVAQRCGCGVLVALGGDLAIAGPVPAAGWRVLVRDGDTDPGVQVAMPAGGALATSSTVGRTWRRGDQWYHHVLDPRTGEPAAPVWRTVSVAASCCVEANTLSTAAIVRGVGALPWLGGLGVAARLVGRNGRVVALGGWPVEGPS